MAYNESTRNYDTILFTREIFYLAVGCALFLAIHWLKGVSNRITEKTSALA